MQAVVPALRITNYARSKNFYERLGFQVDWEHRFEPDFPVFMQISREDMRLFLTEHSGDCEVRGLVHFYVPDVDAWYEECRGKGIPVHEPPNEGIEGLRMMTVVDPDTNRLRIVTVLGQTDTADL
jgi:catechol 2,3-dioxygenase-like lactoylglutathione lyase family enzyme